METLPLELLQDIFQLACVDGGLTGCSLALTSKAVRAAAHSTRFHTVALIARPQRLTAFLAQYADQPRPAHGDGRARVRHLSLSLPTRPDAPQDVRALFRAVAPDLVSLTMRVYFAHDRKSELASLLVFDSGAPFPALRELTVLGLTGPGVLHRRGRSRDNPGETGRPLFPAVLSLHLLPTFAPCDLHAWLAHAPRATSFRVSHPAGVTPGGPASDGDPAAMARFAPAFGDELARGWTYTQAFRRAPQSRTVCARAATWVLCAGGEKEETVLCDAPRLRPRPMESGCV
ncbi:hypothetical protein BD413DRAFT_616105 [Trametes elegans]|nr:hypothetical protein BD413DRAFT_616105 [Trametes elegans]